MPTKPFVADVASLPRQSRFGGMMEETAIVMDNALLKFSRASPMSDEMTGRAAAAGKPDVHPFDQVIFLGLRPRRGACSTRRDHELGPGHVDHIPADVPHIGRVLGEEPAFGVDVFAPARGDYFDMAEHQLQHETHEPAAAAPSARRGTTGVLRDHGLVPDGRRDRDDAGRRRRAARADDDRRLERLRRPADGARLRRPRLAHARGAARAPPLRRQLHRRRPEQALPPLRLEDEGQVAEVE